MKARFLIRRNALLFPAAMILLTTGIVCHTNGKVFAQSSKYKFEETINLVNLVNDAAAEVNR